MQDQLRELAELQEQAKAQRKRGDALRRAGREEAAVESYDAGVSLLTRAVALLEPAEAELRSAEPPLSEELETRLHELVEVYGARAGLLQRLGRPKQALESYSAGAELEQRFALPGTYNRLNALKSQLLSGDQRLRDLEPQLERLATHIDDSLRADKALSDSGWAWADLGDCLALLGRTEEARRAYLSFIAKAELKSPERALGVLEEIGGKLRELGDPDAPRLESAIAFLKSRLASG